MWKLAHPGCPLKVSLFISRKRTLCIKLSNEKQYAYLQKSDGKTAFYRWGPLPKGFSPLQCFDFAGGFFVNLSRWLSGFRGILKPLHIPRGVQCDDIRVEPAKEAGLEISHAKGKFLDLSIYQRERVCGTLALEEGKRGKRTDKIHSCLAIWPLP